MLNLSENIYGHDLNKILQKADENKIKAYIALTDDHCVYIRLASNYYSGKVFEYPTVFEAMQCYPDMPPIDELFSAATILVESLRQSCLEAK